MPILIDTHVHIYPDFSVSTFLDAAWGNFNRTVSEVGLLGDVDCVLALTESKGCDVFWEFAEDAVLLENDSKGVSKTSSWRFYRTAESESLIVCKGEAKLVLIAGRQIISRENVELLSLFCSLKVEDRTLPLAELAQLVADKGGLPVLPWGVGKWWGARGRVVSDLINSNVIYSFFLADSGNRPIFWPKPALLRQACDMHIPVLSGSDPLPIASHVIRPGTSGVVLADRELSREHPGACLRKSLVSEKEIASFGGRTGTLPFIIDQLRMNLRNSKESCKS